MPWRPLKIDCLPSPFFLGTVLPSSFTTHYYYFLIMNNFPPFPCKDALTHRIPNARPLAWTHASSGTQVGAMLMPRVKGGLVHDHPTCCLLSLGPMPVCRSVCCLPVCLPAAPVQVTIWRVTEQARRGPLGQHHVERSNPGESTPPRGNPLACKVSYRLGRVGSCDITLRLVAHCQHLCLWPGSC